jgi:hypothetical protein
MSDKSSLLSHTSPLRPATLPVPDSRANKEQKLIRNSQDLHHQLERVQRPPSSNEKPFQSEEQKQEPIVNPSNKPVTGEGSRTKVQASKDSNTLFAAEREKSENAGVPPNSSQFAQDEEEPAPFSSLSDALNSKMANWKKMGPFINGVAERFLESRPHLDIDGVGVDFRNEERRLSKEDLVSANIFEKFYDMIEKSLYNSSMSALTREAKGSVHYLLAGEEKRKGEIIPNLQAKAQEESSLLAQFCTQLLPQITTVLNRDCIDSYFELPRMGDYSFDYDATRPYQSIEMLVDDGKTPPLLWITYTLRDAFLSVNGKPELLLTPEKNYQEYKLFLELPLKNEMIEDLRDYFPLKVVACDRKIELEEHVKKTLSEQKLASSTDVPDLSDKTNYASLHNEQKQDLNEKSSFLDLDSFDDFASDKGRPDTQTNPTSSSRTLRSTLAPFGDAAKKVASAVQSHVVSPIQERLEARREALSLPGDERSRERIKNLLQRELESKQKKVEQMLESSTSAASSVLSVSTIAPISEPAQPTTGTKPQALIFGEQTKTAKASPAASTSGVSEVKKTEEPFDDKAFTEKHPLYALIGKTPITVTFADGSVKIYDPSTMPTGEKERKAEKQTAWIQMKAFFQPLADKDPTFLETCEHMLATLVDVSKTPDKRSDDKGVELNLAIKDSDEALKNCSYSFSYETSTERGQGIKVEAKVAQSVSGFSVKDKAISRGSISYLSYLAAGTVNMSSTVVFWPKLGGAKGVNIEVQSSTYERKMKADPKSKMRRYDLSGPEYVRKINTGFQEDYVRNRSPEGDQGKAYWLAQAERELKGILSVGSGSSQKSNPSFEEVRDTFFTFIDVRYPSVAQDQKEKIWEDLQLVLNQTIGGRIFFALNEQGVPYLPSGLSGKESIVFQEDPTNQGSFLVTVRFSDRPFRAEGKTHHNVSIFNPKADNVFERDIVVIEGDQDIGFINASMTIKVTPVSEKEEPTKMEVSDGFGQILVNEDLINKSIKEQKQSSR